jgi:hypothetical protein
MERPAPTFERSFLLQRTRSASRRFEGVLAMARRLTEDPEKGARQARQYCKPCYYEERLAGQAITEQPCACCSKPQTYASTLTDVLCLECAREHELCKRCGADIEIRIDRKVWPV